MAYPKFSLFLFLVVFFIVSSLSSELIVEARKKIDCYPSVTENVESYALTFTLPKELVTKKPRKLLEAEVVQLDYDYAGPNPKHDPRKGRGGRG